MPQERHDEVIDAHDRTLVALPAMADVVLGCAPSSGLYFKDVSVAEFVELLDAAAAVGIRELDTAPLYGCGRSEAYIAAAAQSRPALFAASPTSASRCFSVATKVGRLIRSADDPLLPAADAPDGWRVERYDGHFLRDATTERLVCVANYTPEGLVQSVAESRDRLGPAAKCLRRVRIHDAESDFRCEELLQTGGVAGLALHLFEEEKEEVASSSSRPGVVSLGLGMNRPDFIMKILEATAPPSGGCKPVIDHVLMAGAYNLLDTTGRSVVDACHTRGIDVHVAGVFGAGLLWGSSKYRYDDASTDVLATRAALQASCEAHGVPLPWLAIYFATRPASVKKLVIGCATAAELRQCADVLGMTFPRRQVASLVEELCHAGLLPTEASCCRPL